MTSLPIGDHTPVDYCLPVEGFFEILKRPVRRLGYPIYNAINHSWLAHRYATEDFQPDLWLWGQRGNDYERHRRRINSFLPLKDKNVLIAGCGTARDVESWVAMKPRFIQGVDWFSYENAWVKWKQRFSSTAPEVRVDFCQGNLADMSGFDDKSFDVIGSDAVFEHIKNIPEVLSELHRILRPGGILYATFGPLWYGWGGDHVSGYDGITSGYNHLLLEKKAYAAYLDAMGEHTHSEHDGRTWIEHDLFSHLKPKEYVQYLEAAGFERVFMGASIDPKAVACLNDMKLSERLLKQFECLDLLVSAMTIIFRRKNEKSEKC